MVGTTGATCNIDVNCRGAWSLKKEAGCFLSLQAKPVLRSRQSASRTMQEDWETETVYGWGSLNGRRDSRGWLRSVTPAVHYDADVDNMIGGPAICEGSDNLIEANWHRLSCICLDCLDVDENTIGATTWAGWPTLITAFDQTPSFHRVFRRKHAA